MGIFPPCDSSEVMEKLLGSVCGKTRDDPIPKIEGKVVLMKKNVMDSTDLWASFVDRVHELFGRGISLQLISSEHFDLDDPKRGRLGKEAYLEDWVTKLTSLKAEDEVSYDVEFDDCLGIPGAFVIRNRHHSQIYLKSLELQDVPGHSGPLHFVCDSWVYPSHRYDSDRLFFSNKAYLPSEMPPPLIVYREQELKNLRGKGSGELKEWDRVYDYAYYNDLGSPEKGEDHARPVLGGPAYPYPRRARTDPNTESRLFLLNLNIYVPRDEKFAQVKFSDFIGYAIKSVGQVLVPEIKALFDKTFNEFDTFNDVLSIYETRTQLPDDKSLAKIKDCVPWELLRELIRSDGERFLNFPVPEVIQADKTAWRTDEEFGREMLAGVNPVVIRLLDEFPPRSKLDTGVYGNQDSIITTEDMEKNMNGLTVIEAIEKKKLFILDHHDALMPYLRRINTTSTKTYATRTLLLLEENGTLKPLAIELSLPHESGDSHGAVRRVFTPCNEGVGGMIWQLAKAYAAVNDSGFHQLISHWLNTHAVIEPFSIATNRQLSTLHPIYKLLKPHFRDTIHINALARHTLINAGGVLETTVFPGRYAMEMSSLVYSNWNFTDQALPKDLLKRGVAVPDRSRPHGLRLLIEDYPFAVDGLEIWSAINLWVTEYCSLYYLTDEKVTGDVELQSWWKEIREVGHGDLSDKPWWPEMATRDDLIECCTIVIWVASALHAAVNFGQYAYAGYLPNRPTVSRRFMPELGSPEYAELENEENHEVAFLKTITAQFQTLLGVSLIEMLSRHSTDEIYLGQRETPYWTGDREPVQAFERFSASLVEIEDMIKSRNLDPELRNRTGPVQMPYMLLYPNTSDDTKKGGLNVKGIPNSVSI
ncbi:hypothetical protein SASPL_103816 [Salvia splendens]|uniref:Lipoxygenase n=1 Tax=Salvia splendens TaxID=180675 RepID=A0A8X8YLN8_SALSN|nr:hypothetical protein SASPL_103816 [Salvia splendens]